MHFRNEKCRFTEYGAEDLVARKPEAVHAGTSEVASVADRLSEGQILILGPAL
jgi:hypothetical protein